jgi:mannose-6-phosphate isomerase-like protein (cupin superfamily)
MKKAIGSKRRDPAFSGQFDTDALSITYVKIWGRLRRMLCEETDRVMFIIEGDAIAKVADEPPGHVRAGDFILIPKGTPYELKGNCTYLVINSPAYREGSDLRNNAYDGPPQRTGENGWIGTY